MDYVPANPAVICTSLQFADNCRQCSRDNGLTEEIESVFFIIKKREDVLESAQVRGFGWVGRDSPGPTRPRRCRSRSKRIRQGGCFWGGHGSRPLSKRRQVWPFFLLHGQEEQGWTGDELLCWSCSGAYDELRWEGNRELLMGHDGRSYKSPSFSPTDHDPR